MSWIDEFTRPVTPHYSAAALNTAVSGAGLSPSTNLFADRRTISRPADFNPPGWTPASFYTENNITPPQFAISDLAQYTSGASPAPITPPPGAGPSVTAPPLVSPTGHPVLFANNQAPVPSPAPSTGGMTPDIGFIPRTAPQATPNGGFQISPRGGSPVPQQNNFQNRLMQSLMFLSSPGLSGGFGGFGGGFVVEASVEDLDPNLYVHFLDLSGWVLKGSGALVILSEVSVCLGDLRDSVALGLDFEKRFQGGSHDAERDRQVGNSV